MQFTVRVLEHAGIGMLTITHHVDNDRLFLNKENHDLLCESNQIDKYLYDERVWRKEQSDGKTLLTDVFPITGDPMDNHYMYRPMVEPRLLRQNDQVDRYLNEDRLFLNKENHDVLRESDQVDPCTDEDRKLWVNLPTSGAAIGSKK